MNKNILSLPIVLSKAVKDVPLDKMEIKYLLSLTGRSDIELLHRVARMVRKKHFGNKVFMYGFLYFSNNCKNNCNFCQYRSSNKDLVRYRKNEEEVIEVAKQLAASGVHLIDLTMGEDPAIFHPDFGLKRLLRLIERVQIESGLPVMVSPGAVPEMVINQLAAAGAEWFACYQETHSRQLFKKLRPGQSFGRRMNTKFQAKSGGMLIEEGILTGVGETLNDITDSIFVMRSMGANQVRAMTFVPQKGTPMESVLPSDSQLERIIISVMRLVLPDALIPASLDLDGLNGLQKRLQAGANVITSIVPPGRGLTGVANSRLDIEESRRSVESIRSILHFSGLKAELFSRTKAIFKML
jgi:methylornithine synthase